MYGVWECNVCELMIQSDEVVRPSTYSKILASKSREHTPTLTSRERSSERILTASPTPCRRSREHTAYTLPL